MRALPLLILLLVSRGPEQDEAPKKVVAAKLVPAQPVPATIDYRKEVQPIFEKNCNPCHFPGGKMHARLPFDDGATIAKLGKKVFSRIKDEPSRERIRKYLATAQPTAAE